MLWSRSFFVNRKSTAIEGFGCSSVAFIIEQQSQVVEACGRFGMLWSQSFFVNRKGTTIKGFGSGVVAFIIEQQSQVVEA